MEIENQKTIVVVFSCHHGNTAKLAERIAEVLDARIAAPRQTDPGELAGYDLAGFGSGIYDGKHHASLLELAENLPPVRGRKAFIFSTDGMPRALVKSQAILRDKMSEDHAALREILLFKGYEIAGEFNCAGWNTNSFLKIWGGINKGRPDSKDLDRAAEFARGMQRKI